MGWYGTYCNEDLKSIKKVIEENVNFKTNKDNKIYESKCLYHSFKFGESYMAVKYKVIDEDGKILSEEVYGLVTLWRYSKKDGQVMLKTIEETAGPVATKAPAKLLKMLDPPKNSYSHNWRVRCWRKFKKIPKEYLELKYE